MSTQLNRYEVEIRLNPTGTIQTLGFCQVYAHDGSHAITQAAHILADQHKLFCNTGLWIARQIITILPHSSPELARARQHLKRAKWTYLGSETHHGITNHYFISKWGIDSSPTY